MRLHYLFSVKMLTLFVCLVVLRWHSVNAVIGIPIITRDTYDLIQFSNCSRYNRERLNCHEVFASRTGDQRKCTCKCKKGYVTYRDPYIKFERSEYRYKDGERGCVWYANYHEGCRGLRSIHQEKYKRMFPSPIIVDLTHSGSVTLQVGVHFPNPGCLTIVPSVQIPGTKQWNKIGIKFQLNAVLNSTDPLFLLQWISNSNDIYAHQGLVMRLDLFPCFQDSKIDCIMTKIAGTYTAPENCRRRAVDGRCCVLPFVHDGVLHNDCITTNDEMKGPWCAVSLNSAITEGNHKWRANCQRAEPSTTPTLRPTTTHTPAPTLPASTVEKERPFLQPISPTHPAIYHSPTPSPTSLVTVSAFPPMGNTTTTTMAPPADHGSPESSSRGSDVNVTLIVAVIAGLLVLLVIVILIVFFCHRRRHRQENMSNKKGVSHEDLVDEAPYASLQGDTPPTTRKMTNHGFVGESMEMSNGNAGANRPGGMASEKKADIDANFYDSVAEGAVGNQVNPIYNVPEADYTLITTPSKGSRPSSPLNDDPSKHVYSVLERNNDPLKRPQPVDNDAVFVEANPLYSTMNDINAENEQAQRERTDDEESQATSSRNIYDVPEATDEPKKP